MTADPCQCPTFNIQCPRAGVVMTERLWELCSGHDCSADLSDKYRTMWDKNTANGNVFKPDNPDEVSVPRSMRAVEPSGPGEDYYGLGNWAHDRLDQLGVTQERVEDFLGAPCNCPERIEKLNALGKVVTEYAAATRDKAIGAVRRLFGRNDVGDDVDQQSKPGVGVVDQKLVAVTKIPRRVMKWAYGVTCIPARRGVTLELTLKSLADSGFPKPRLFLDGASHQVAANWQKQYGLDVTAHDPALRPYGNFITGMWELYARDTACDYYAMFQDDVVASKNLRAYLERSKFPDKVYLNLYTCIENHEVMPMQREGGKTPALGWHLPDAKGHGGLALVFSRAAVMDLLSSRNTTEKPQDVHKGHFSLDGAVWQSLAGNLGYKEYIHYPSLVQHIGAKSSIGNFSNKRSTCFFGENFDLLSILPK